MVTDFHCLLSLAYGNTLRNSSYPGALSQTPVHATKASAPVIEIQTDVRVGLRLLELSVCRYAHGSGSRFSAKYGVYRWATRPSGLEEILENPL